MSILLKTSFLKFPTAISAMNKKLRTNTYILPLSRSKHHGILWELLLPLSL